MVSLKQLTGRRRKPTGQLVEVSYPVDSIMENGRRVGYVGRHEDAHIVLLQYADKGRKADILSAVTELPERTSVYGKPSGLVTCPPQEAEVVEEIQELAPALEGEE